MRRSLPLLLGGAALAAFVVTRAWRRDFSFRGKNVLITGGSRGLGFVMARQICRDGGRVALVARDEAELGRAVGELRRSGGYAIAITADLTDPDQTEQVAEEAMTRLGSVDVLINNAGIIEVGPLAHMSRQDFERSMKLHFWAALDLMRAVIPHMRERGGGRIVNIASIGGEIGVPHLVPYCASKFALVGLSDSMRAELAGENIRITTVAPGLMRTGSHVHARFKGDHGAEFGWFSVAAGLPLISISAERAASKILAACRAGRSALTFPFVSRMAIAGSAAFPNLAAGINALVNDFLPKPTGGAGDQLRSGRESRTDSALPGWFTRRFESAVERNNESGTGPVP